MKKKKCPRCQRMVQELRNYDGELLCEGCIEECEENILIQEQEEHDEEEDFDF